MLQKSLTNFLISVKKFLRCFFFLKIDNSIFCMNYFFLLFCTFFFLINQKKLKFYFSNLDIFFYTINKKKQWINTYFFLFDNFDNITIKLQFCFVEIRQKHYQIFHSNQLSNCFVFWKFIWNKCQKSHLFPRNQHLNWMND